MAVLHTSWITSRGQLETAFKAIAKLEYGYTLKAMERTRTDEQNRLLWPCLKAFEKQATLNGQTLRDDQWKSVFLQALGYPQDMLPTLDGKTWFAAGLRSSTLAVKEFSDLIELINSEAAARGVELEKV